MSQKYIIGVDGGSQSSKVLIFDLEGRVICSGKQNLRPMQMPAPGVVEHPDDDLWDSITVACRKAMDAFPGDVRDIVGLGLCTIRCCRVLLKEDGSLAAPAISWMDLRLSRPYEHSNPEVAYVTTTSGYIAHRFTGVFADTAANYLGEWPIDYDTWDWSEDPEVLARYKIKREMLFHLQPPGSVLGSVTREASLATGIPEGIPVIATANDKAVEALGCGLSDERTALISLGTYICGMTVGDKNYTGTSNFFTNMASLPNRFLYESGGIRRGMWTVSWWVDLLGEGLINEAQRQGLSPEDLLNREAALLPAGSEGLLTLPEWLAPPDAPHKRGLMIGFNAKHTRAHIYRSILESIALTMKNHVEAMMSELDRPLERIIVSGGGSNSDLFMQIFADVFGKSAIRNEMNGAAGLGAAICAAVGTCSYPSFAAASEKMIKIRDNFAPDAQRSELYSRINSEVFKNLSAYNSEILQKMHTIYS